jgi:hypothetical protein
MIAEQNNHASSNNKQSIYTSKKQAKVTLSFIPITRNITIKYYVCLTEIYSSIE